MVLIQWKPDLVDRQRSVTDNFKPFGWIAYFQLKLTSNSCLMDPTIADNWLQKPNLDVAFCFGLEQIVIQLFLLKENVIFHCEE